MPADDAPKTVTSQSDDASGVSVPESSVNQSSVGENVATFATNGLEFNIVDAPELTTTTVTNTTLTETSQNQDFNPDQNPDSSFDRRPDLTPDQNADVSSDDHLGGNSDVNRTEIFTEMTATAESVAETSGGFSTEITTETVAELSDKIATETAIDHPIELESEPMPEPETPQNQAKGAKSKQSKPKKSKPKKNKPTKAQRVKPQPFSDRVADLVPQPSPLECGVCQQSAWTWHANIPLEVKSRKLAAAIGAEEAIVVPTHGTAWRCQNCGALSLSWPIEVDLIEPDDLPPLNLTQTRDTLPRWFTGNLAGRKGLRFLDLNCGSGDAAGNTLVALHELGLAKHQLFGISRDRTVVDQLNLAGFQLFGDANSPVLEVLTELPDAYFDWILAIDIIETCAHPREALELMAQKLKPGGRLVFELANAESWHAKLFRQGDWSGYRPDRHTLFGTESLRSYLSQAGLSLETVAALPDINAWTDSSIRWATHRRKRRLPPVVQSRVVRKTFASLDRLRITLGLETSRFQAIGRKPLP